MINLSWGDDLDLRSTARQLIKGHQTFLRASTGNTTNGETDRFIINPQGVIADHMHYTNKTAMQGYPNNYGTTEGQTLLIMGHLYSYVATRDSIYLDEAEAAFNAMVKYFYSEDVPSTTRRWVSNWTLNAKEPVLANYPFNPVDPTLGGFKGVLLNYTNGRAIIPAGSPYYGEYLDKATFAYVGVLSWDSIVGDVVKLNADGSVDYSLSGTKYPVDWVVDYLHRKVSYTGAVVESNSTLPVGTVQLQNTTLTGKYKTNFCTRNPVSAGGRIIERNQHWYQYPLYAPSPGSNFDTNASDAELWFADACNMLWQLTGNERYKRAHDCSLFTIREYMDIDSSDKYFRKSLNATSPFTDGISYMYTYPQNYQPRFSRTNIGVNVIPVDGTYDVTFEQQAIWFKVNNASALQIEMSGTSADVSPVSRTIELELNTKKDLYSSTTYIFQMNDALDSTLSTETIPLTNFVHKYDNNNNTYNIANMKAVKGYGNTIISTGVQSNVVDGRNAFVLSANIQDTSSGLIIGAWLNSSARFSFDSMYFKCDNDVVLRLIDDDAWIWETVLESTNNAWAKYTRATASVKLSAYQPNHGSTETKPSSPRFSTFIQVELLPVSSANFSYYCIDGLPALYDGSESYTMKVRCTWSTTATSATYYLGDFTCTGYLKNNLAFTPGVVPFSNNYRPSNNSTFDGYRGLPYAAYQYPSVYVNSGWEDTSTLINNVIAFMKSGQDTWVAEGGEPGPSKTAYIWDRWDNLQQSPNANTWLTATTGDTVWPGYQPRCHYAAARCWYEMVMSNYPVPDSLIQYVDKWTNFIIKFQKNNNGRFPNTYTNLRVGVTEVIAGDTCGLHLAALAYTYLAGSTLSGIQVALDTGMKEVIDFYTVVPGGNQMNGTWTPDVNGKWYFGFWTGELMRGISMYILAKDYEPKTDILKNIKKGN